MSRTPSPTAVKVDTDLPETAVSHPPLCPRPRAMMERLWVPQTSNTRWAGPASPPLQALPVTCEETQAQGGQVARWSKADSVVADPQHPCNLWVPKPVLSYVLMASVMRTQRGRFIVSSWGTHGLFSLVLPSRPCLFD